MALLQQNIATMRRPPLGFLSLPPEIRLNIYELLLVDRSHTSLSIRTERPETYAKRQRYQTRPRRRTEYWVKSGLRGASVESTYILQAGPELHPSILLVSRQVHAEAAHVLYGSYVFDFAKDVESVVPFLSDLTTPALSAIRRIKIVKRALPYTRDFDRYEWSAVCEFLAKRLELQHLALGIAGGKCDSSYYQATDTFNKSDFKRISKFDGMEWMQELVAIKGLRNLDIRTIWEVCPPPCSNALAFFVNFSASIETGFADYLRENMVMGTA